ncbi:hypothetical protein ABCR94_04595 [Streptomyces sp. 21So2-11]
MSDPTTETASLSPECAVALRLDYEYLHAECGQAEDVPLPWGAGLLLVHRCTCLCHGYNRQDSTQDTRFSQAPSSPRWNGIRKAPAPRFQPIQADRRDGLKSVRHDLSPKE